MLCALRNYQQVQSWHKNDECGCAGPVQVDPHWTPNPDINTVLPESGVGFRTYNREADGVDQVGLPSTIEYFVNLGKEWDATQVVPFQVGDISRRGGGPFPPHSGHKNGNEADLRPFRKDGAMLPTNIQDPNYDRDTTREFIKLVKHVSPDTLVLFNDPTLIKEGLCKYHKGHHNHLHLRLQPTTSEEVGC